MNMVEGRVNKTLPETIYNISGFVIGFTALADGPDDMQPTIGQSAVCARFRMTTSKLLAEIASGPAGVADTVRCKVSGGAARGMPRAAMSKVSISVSQPVLVYTA